MDKYRRVPKEKAERESIGQNEIRVVATSQRSTRNYISYAINLFTAEGDKAQRSVTLRAMGRAINRTINVCEIIKRRVPGLHQLTKLESNSIVDSYEPLVQGLDPKNITRTVSAISIVLSKDGLDTSDPGYQAPLPESEIQTEEQARAARQAKSAEAAAAGGGEGGRGRGRGRGRPRRGGRGGRGGRAAAAAPEAEAPARGRGRPRRGRGAGGDAPPARGGRGGYSGAPAGGRGGAAPARGRGGRGRGAAPPADKPAGGGRRGRGGRGRAAQ